MASKVYHLFSAYGIEIEYMIVDQERLNVLPICDRILEKLAGKMKNEVKLGRIAASNELALHVLELKTNGPRPSLAGLSDDFHEAIAKIQDLLKAEGAFLMPTGMHPWFDPSVGFCLWPHGDKTIYNTYHQIFNCAGHGWSNLQSTHINLPFANDEEFYKLHAAIRFILPLIPALTAGTPFMQSALSGVKDTRLEFYGKNQKAIPKIAGDIVPESVRSEAEYERDILLPMYEAISTHDPKKILQHEWLNSRGAIARFDRHAIEIRIMDAQECPKADIACVNLISESIRYFIEQGDLEAMSSIETRDLKTLYLNSIEEGMTHCVDNPGYLTALGLSADESKTTKEIWALLFDRVKSRMHADYIDVIEAILSAGNLSERIIRAYEARGANAEAMFEVYRELCVALSENQLFYVNT